MYIFKCHDQFTRIMNYKYVHAPSFGELWATAQIPHS